MCTPPFFYNLGSVKKKVKKIYTNIIYCGRNRYCPICGKHSRIFREYGVIPRKDAQCIFCGSRERHRLLWLFLQRKTNLFTSECKNKKMLHIAPEKYFKNKFRLLLGENYITADLYKSSAMVKMDITNIEYPEKSFDIIVCNHVLEHVLDDIKAIKEFFRVLKDDGWAILLVPITSEKTIEDPLIVSPQERFRIFGQKDHVRRYGKDYIERLRSAGFQVAVTKASEIASDNEIIKMGLSESPESEFEATEIYCCTK
ncbi:class I SAM-dependent methyltransferase [Treponema primitia]|uniref:class I SAM-dependent methyltransferase n=1 Tax=Treponema primitia TaxID=88058 RepID=UPI0002D2E603|nr:class I SAM-dependent methyltransferase [Treponema primitia]